MRIFYANKEIKNICEDHSLDLNVETILKEFEDCLGKKICVLEYSETESHVKTLKVKCMQDKSYKTITIKYDNRPYMQKSMGVSHLVTISENNSNDNCDFSQTYEVGEYVASKISDDYYNKETSLLIHKTKLMRKYIKESMTNANNYILKMNDKICNFAIRNDLDNNVFKLLEFKSLDLKTVYENLKNMNKEYIKNIEIAISNKNNSEYEKLSINNNQLIEYKRIYSKGDILITLVYRDGNVEVTTKQQLKEEEVIKTKEIDVTEELQKVKKMFIHN